MAYCHAKLEPAASLGPDANRGGNDVARGASAADESRRRMSGAVGSRAEATLAARQRLSRGVEADLAALRRQRPARRVAEIIFFLALWLIGIGLGLAALRATGAA